MLGRREGVLVPGPLEDLLRWGVGVLWGLGLGAAVDGCLFLSHVLAGNLFGETRAW